MTPKTRVRRRYHHGDLRRVLLDEAIAAIEESGVAALSLRDLARRAGVSHAAPAHHFGDKEGLLTAVAVEGYRRFADSLRDAYEGTGEFLEVGVAYVRFALENRGFFEVMFQPDLFDESDPELAAARDESRVVLYGHVQEAAGRRSDPRMAGIAAWSLVHGLATLLLNNSIPGEVGDREAFARSVASQLFSGMPPGRRRASRR